MLLPNTFFFSPWIELQEHCISDYMRIYNALSLWNYKFFETVDWVISYYSEHKVLSMDSSCTAGFHKILQLIPWRSRYPKLFLCLWRSLWFNWWCRKDDITLVWTRILSIFVALCCKFQFLLSIIRTWFSFLHWKLGPWIKVFCYARKY